MFSRSNAGLWGETGSRCAILAMFVVGLRRRDPGTVVNAVVALAGTAIPGAAERAFDVELRPWQRLYVDAAMVTHVAGMLGMYDDVRWWDHLTHTLSASALGGFVYAGARRRGRDPEVPVVAAVVGLGATWELVEYLVHVAADRLDREPVLVFYSTTDTLQDAVFDLVGAGLVLRFGDRLLENLVATED